MADKRYNNNISVASNATTGFLNPQASANLDDVIKVLDAALKSISVAGAGGGIAIGIWKYSEISAAFSRIIKGTATPADKKLAKDTIKAGGAPVQEVLHTAARALQGNNEVPTGDRLEETANGAQY